MTRKIFNTLIAIFLLVACKPTSNITSYYVNKEVTPKASYQTIFVFMISPDNKVKLNVENRMEKLLNSRGKKVVKSSDLFPQTESGLARLSVDQNVGKIKEAGCDAILTITGVAEASNESYNPGTAYVPTTGGFGYYSGYYGYYSYYAPMVSTPGFYSADKTYYMETNFYDLESDKLLWAIKSASYNPGSFEIWFQDYSGTILSQLKKDGLIKK
jgi:hypothetical protein